MPGRAALIAIPLPGAAARRAALWMTGVLICFTTMAVAVRELSANHGAFSILAMRSVVGLAVVGPAALWLGTARLRTRMPAWQAARNLVHFVGQAGWTWGLTALPLATVFTLEFTVPAWVAVFAVCFLGERLTLGRAVAVCGGVAGVLVILTGSGAGPVWAMAVVLGAAAAYAGAHTITKHLTRGDGILPILFWMLVVQLPIGLVLSAAFEDWRLPDAADAPWVLAVGLAALGAHFCLTRALATADAIVVMPLDFLRLPLVAVVAAWLYDEALAAEVAAGAAIIVASLLYALRRER